RSSRCGCARAPMRARALLAALIAGAAACATAADTTALRASYPEGPLWQGEQLYFAEMRADRVSLYAGGERRTFFAEPGCGPTALAPYGDGLLILCHLGGGLVAVDAAGRETRRWRQASDGAPLGNPNDASADGRGGVYFSDPGAFSRAAPAE